MALRILRLVAVASILAFGVTARTVTATQAHTDDIAADRPPAVADLPPADLGEQPPPTDLPPTEPPPVAVEPPPADPVGPAPTDAPLTDAPLTDTPLTDTPLTDTPVAAEPPPTASDAPFPSEEAVPASTASPDASPTVGDPAVSDPSAAEPLPSPVAVSPIAEDPADTATAPKPALPHAVPKPIVSEPVVASAPVAARARQPAHEPDAVQPAARPVEASRSVAPGWLPHVTGLILPDEVQPVTAGIVAGLAVTNTAPASVAVAIEFGRAGGGWAGGIVFNLWLRRKLRERPMSQRQLAALSGVDHSTISRLLRQDRTPSLATATKLAKALRHVRVEPGESDTADYFDRIPEETLFPARRVEMALRADELLDDDDVRRLMNDYLDARRRRQTTASSNELLANGRLSAPARAGPTRSALDPRR